MASHVLGADSGRRAGAGTPLNIRPRTSPRFGSRRCTAKPRPRVFEKNPVKPTSETNSDRFLVRYRLTGDEARPAPRPQIFAWSKPSSALPIFSPRDSSPSRLLGRLESLQKSSAPGAPAYEALVSFLNDTTGGELTQLCNVLFATSALRRTSASRLEDGGTLWGKFKGPRFGRAGLRALLGRAASTHCCPPP